VYLHAYLYVWCNSNCTFSVKNSVRISVCMLKRLYVLRKKTITSPFDVLEEKSRKLFHRMVVISSWCKFFVTIQRRRFYVKNFKEKVRNGDEQFFSVSTPQNYSSKSKGAAFEIQIKNDLKVCQKYTRYVIWNFSQQMQMLSTENRTVEN